MLRLASLFTFFLAVNAYQVNNYADHWLRPVEITIFNFQGPNELYYQEILDPEIVNIGSLPINQLLSNEVLRLPPPLPSLPIIPSNLPALRQFSTNEVRGPFITPVQQNSQSEQIVETAEDEVESPKWSYSGPTGPNYWPKVYPECGGKSQSPINIQPYMTYQRPGIPIVAENYDRLYPTILEKGKKNVDLGLEGHKQKPWIAGGYIPMGESYEFANLYFHWGSNNSVGSEHRFGGYEFPAEAHFVHFNRKYGNLTNAADKPDGLLVLGFFLQIAKKSGPGMSVIADGIRSLDKTGNSEVDLGKLSIDAVLGHIPLVEYFFYQGSLTTPPCTENVLWHVFSNTIQISQRDLDAFRDLKKADGKSFSDNNRPVLPLNGRKVLRNVIKHY